MGREGEQEGGREKGKEGGRKEGCREGEQDRAERGGREGGDSQRQGGMVVSRQDTQRHRQEVLLVQKHHTAYAMQSSVSGMRSTAHYSSYSSSRHNLVCY